MAEVDNDFGGGESGASTTYPAQCSSLRKNGHVMIKERPCKIVEMSTSKTGKHGHAKVHMVGLDIFTGRKYEDICPSTHNMNVPNVSRKDYTLVNIEDGYAHLMDDGGDMREDMKVPDGDLGKEIQTKFDNGDEFLCTVLSAVGEEQIIALKAITKKE